MNNSVGFSLTTALLVAIPCNVNAEDEVTLCSQKDKIALSTHNIFDLDDPDTIFLHRWANFLHIKTKQTTLYNEAAFFLKKCEVNQDDLAELERHLRGKKFLRDARISYSDDAQKINVETWDNWSLLPTVDFGRKGGKNKYAIGLKDRNFLGLGIDTEIESFTNDQRSGYKLKTHFPLYLNNNITASIRLTSNDDGSSEAAYLQKPFVSFDTTSAFKLGFDNFNQVDTQYKLGKVFNKFEHQQELLTASWHWLHEDSQTDTLRFGFGYTKEQHTFQKSSAIVDEFDASIPENREFNYPYFSVEYLEKDFKKLTNVNLINHIEDFNLGWQITADIGTDVSGRSDSPSLIWRTSVSKGVELFPDSFWFFTASFDGEQYSASNTKDRSLVNLSNEFFYKFNDTWSAYLKNTTQLSKNPFKDSPTVLGGTTGVRGYPLQYRHGEHSTQFTFEARFYPHINVYKLLELGGAVFIDTGKVFGKDDNFSAPSSWMSSVGIGARLYSTQTSEARVIHLDIIKPLSSDADVNSVEFRVTTKHSF